MSKNKSIGITRANVEAIQDDLTSDLVKRYGSNNAKAVAADRARYYANQYLFNRPIGMAQNYRLADLQVEMRDYVEKMMEKDSPKGFFFGGELIIGWILAAVVSWVVRRILDKLMDLD